VSILQATKKFIYKVKALKNPKRGNFSFDDNTLDAAIGFNEYGAYCLPNKSKMRPAVQKVMRNKVYEPQTIAFMRKIIANNTGDVIHAGTFFGDFLPALSKAIIHKEQKIWAFEPNTESYNCAKITLLLNNIKNVELTNAGLGNEQQQQHLQIKDATGTYIGGASNIVKTAILNETEAINIVRIDDVVSKTKKISIIQLDVEGYELPALKGALATIQQQLPILILEDNLNAIETDWFKNNIFKLGYTVSNTLHNNIVLKRQ